MGHTSSHLTKNKNAITEQPERKKRACYLKKSYEFHVVFSKPAPPKRGGFLYFFLCLFFRRLAASISRLAPRPTPRRIDARKRSNIKQKVHPIHAGPKIHHRCMLQTPNGAQKMKKMEHLDFSHNLYRE